MLMNLKELKFNMPITENRVLEIALYFLVLGKLTKDKITIKVDIKYKIFIVKMYPIRAIFDSKKLDKIAVWKRPK